jgi:hypothetical protein
MPAPRQICTQVTRITSRRSWRKCDVPGRGARRAAWLADPGRSNSAAVQHLFARVIEGRGRRDRYIRGMVCVEPAGTTRPLSPATSRTADRNRRLGRVEALLPHRE